MKKHDIRQAVDDNCALLSLSKMKFAYVSLVALKVE